jgi:hypothetical protein
MIDVPWYPRLLASHAVPWRIRNGLEQWVESSAYARYPGLYRRLHFGHAADPVHALTSGPRHHFFGYYDKSPWNGSGRLLLGHEAGFNDRAPTASDQVGIGVIDPTAGPRFERVGDGHAWNWQQGAMLQWHPADPERLFVHNDRRQGRFVGVLRDVHKGELGNFERPVYAILPDGRTAFSVDFARLAIHRPGYGYAGGRDPHGDDPHPAGDGVWGIDLASGRAELVVSLAELAVRDPRPSMEGAWHYVNHVQPSRGGQRIAFFHVWHRDASQWEVRLYTCKPDGSNLRCLLDTGLISHYDWRDDDTILVWAKRPDAPARFLLLSHAEAAKGEDRGTAFDVFVGQDLREDGHCTYSPDGNWVLNDTYPDGHHKRTLMLVRVADGRRIDVARLLSPKARWWGEIRCDLHPRWSRDGRQVCIDSVHEGTRQMYVVDVGSIVA